VKYEISIMNIEHRRPTWHRKISNGQIYFCHGSPDPLHVWFWLWFGGSV